MNTGHFKRASVCFTLIVVTLLQHLQFAQAYRTFIPAGSARLKFPGSSAWISINGSAVDSALGISGSQGIASNSTFQLFNASWFSIGLATPSINSISATSLAGYVSTACGTQWLGDTAPGYACTHTSGRLIYLNTSSYYDWNTTGTMLDLAPYLRHVDLQTILLHELGHLMGLDHTTYDNGSVMYPQYVSARQTLTTDDKWGITQLYGPWTSWETGYQTVGLIDYVAYLKDATGYNNNSAPPPELGPRFSELGVPVPTGSRYYMMSGFAQANYSYMYFSVFEGTLDWNWSNPSVQHLVIAPGMRLRWKQFNYQQRRMSVDITFTDGTWLRGSGLTDTAGICVHPACRWVYPTGVWHSFEVNLTPLAGKKIRNIMIAYDNGNSGETGQFRGYFDDLMITY
ncbi:MAG: matrixin family metalloprotease [Anaerolineae bacterium]|nr:matrixin family metalloprotease [Anaerolineae bacterium]